MQSIVTYPLNISCCDSSKCEHQILVGEVCQVQLGKVSCSHQTVLDNKRPILEVSYHVLSHKLMDSKQKHFILSLCLSRPC